MTIQNRTKFWGVLLLFAGFMVFPGFSTAPADTASDRYVVELDVPSMAEARQKGLSVRNHRAKIQQSHSRFVKDMEQIKGKGAIRHQYTRVFNGFALQNVTGAELRQIRMLPYVKNVTRDRVYRVQLDDSVPLIGANRSWMEQVNGTNITGKGVKVAVLDTGVMFNHSDLGDCSASEYNGTGCKRFTAGYDVVNDDFIPMDNHGHGTHVAGIIGANGSVKGVAPGVTFMAYKICTGGGSCYTSDMIAGIQRAVDDGADIISMSVGGSGNPDDSASRAVDNAVGNGTVAVIAAGNSYNYYTVASPGTARKAITVGATDKADDIASYSSRGPVTWSGNLLSKPDVLAPGSNICSTSINTGGCEAGYYESMSGTSMATPHVAGAAALLLQARPSWTPPDVKSALMGSAENLGYDAFTQGAGRVNVYRAGFKRVLTSPSTLDYGNITFNRSSTKTLTVKNTGAEPVSVNVSATGATRFQVPESADTASLNRTGFTVAPGSSEKIGVEMDVGGVNGTFYGYVNITTNTSQTPHLVPFAFTRTSVSPVINASYPSSELYLSGSSITANLSIEDYYYNTTAVIDAGGTQHVLWNNTGRTFAETNIDLSQGKNFIVFTVYNTDFPSENTTRNFTVVSDTTAPVYDALVQNTSVVESPGPVRLDVNVSDSMALQEIYLSTNASGSWNPVKQQFGSTSCSDQWGGDCGVEPGNGEIDNTYTACSTGEGDDEHIRETYLDSKAVETGKPVQITVDFHVWGSTDEEYIWVKTPTQWENIWNGSLSKGDHNVTVSYTPEESGEYIVRGIIDFTGEDDYCASGSFYDNDDVKFEATKGYLLDGKNASLNLTWDTPAFNDTLHWMINATDRAGNTVSASGAVEQNDDPVITGYSVRNTSLMEASVIDQGSRAIITVNTTDPNNDTRRVEIEYAEPSDAMQGTLINLTGGTFQLNVTTGGAGGKAWLNLTVVDSLGRNHTVSDSFEIREYQAPRLNTSETSYTEILPNETLDLRANITDNYLLSSAKLATNESGQWKNHSVYGSPEFLSKNGTVAFNWSNNSVRGDVYWRIWTNDTFNNWNASAVTKFEVVEYNVSIPMLEADEDYTFTLETEGSIRLNRSDLGWNYTVQATPFWRSTNPVYTQGFENGTGNFTGTWKISNLSHEGDHAVRSGNISHGETSYLNFSYTPDEDRVLEYRYRVSTFNDVLVFRVNDEIKLMDNNELDWKHDSYFMEAGKTYDFSWAYEKDSSGSYWNDSASIDSVRIGTPEKDAEATIHPMNHGNYTLTVYKNSSTGMLDTHSTEFTANATDLELSSVGYHRPAVAVEGRNFSLDASLFGRGYSSADIWLANQTRGWNLSSNYSELTDERTYYPTGEPYNATDLLVKAPSLDNGTYNLTVNLTLESGIGKSFTENFTVFPSKNVTVNISNPRDVFVFVGGGEFSLDPEDSLSHRWTVDGWDSKSIADISGLNFSYNLMILNNRTGTPFTFWGYVNTSLDETVELDPVYREQEKDLGDKKILAESIQSYTRGEKAVFYSVYNLSRLGVSDSSQYRIYRCGEYDRSSNECSSWSPASETLREKDGDLVGIMVEAGSAEAFGFGKPVSQDSDSSESSPPPSFSGGFSPSEPETTVTGGENVTVWNLDLENETQEFNVPENRLGLEKLVLTAGGPVTGTFLLAEDSASSEDMAVYGAWTVEAPANISSVETGFSVNPEWLDQRNFSSNQLKFYDSSWNPLPTDRTGNETPVYSTTSSNGLLVLAVELPTCNDVSCFAALDEECTEFSSPREIPSNWTRVDSCEEWEQKDQAKRIIEDLEKKVDQPESREKLQQAKKAYEQGNYTRAIQNAQAANRIENDAMNSENILRIAALGGILLVVLGGFFGYRVWKRAILREDLAELSRVLKDEMQAGRLPRDPQILRHINDAREAVNRNDYEKARKELDRLKNYMAPDQ